MNRDEFLSERWSPYPQVPPGSSILGRLTGWGSGESALLAGIWRQGVHQQVPLRTLKNFSGSEIDLAKILIPGDLLAINQVGDVTLLAPWKGSGVFQAFPHETLRQWNRFRSLLAKFFVDRGFDEVPTPGLVSCPGTEPSLDVFSTEWKVGSRRGKVFLPTSPELHLKKALARGLEKIFEMKSCYRNGEITSQHRPEFTMLEWYRAWETPAAIQEDLAQMFDFFAEEMKTEGARKPICLRRTTMADLFRDHLGEILHPQMDRSAYLAMAVRAGLQVSDDYTIDDLFFLLVTEKIEPHLNPSEVTIVEKWPPFQAALARLTPDGWGDRFEIYWQGLELANAFHELNDPVVQRRRFAADLEKKKLMGKEPIPLDEEFLSCLENGMPPSSGIALGVERLYMAIFNVQDIEHLRFFAHPAAAEGP